MDLNFNPEIDSSTAVQAEAQPDGKILIFGDFTQVNGIQRQKMARLHEEGSLDETFNPGSGPSGGEAIITAVAVRPDHSIVVAGDFTAFDGASRDRLALLFGQDPAIPRLLRPVISQDQVQAEFYGLEGSVYLIEMSDTVSRGISNQLFEEWELHSRIEGRNEMEQISIPMNARQKFFWIRVEQQ